jgi:type III pantothenate kinase
MFLAIDIGNTTVSIGYFQNHVLQGSFHVSTADSVADHQAADNVHRALEQRLGKDFEIDGAGISSVVPALTEQYLAMARDRFGVQPRLLTCDQPLSFQVLYDDPRQLGSDRLANVIAARKLYGYPLLVIDLGTATKYDVIDNNGDYVGGLIAPGIWISASALFDGGARLFPVKLERPQRLIGKNTEQALKSGIYNGFLGQIINMKSRLGRELGYEPLKVVATGGYAELFREESGLFDMVDLGLTLKGVEIALNP